MIYHWFLRLVRLSLLSDHILVLFFSGIWFDREAQPKVLNTSCPKSLSIFLSIIITTFYCLLLAYSFCPRNQSHPPYLCLLQSWACLNESIFILPLPPTKLSSRKKVLLTHVYHHSPTSNPSDSIPWLISFINIYWAHAAHTGCKQKISSLSVWTPKVKHLGSNPVTPDSFLNSFFF